MLKIKIQWLIFEKKNDTRILCSISFFGHPKLLLGLLCIEISACVYVVGTSDVGNRSSCPNGGKELGLVLTWIMGRGHCYRHPSFCRCRYLLADIVCNLLIGF